MFTEVEKFFTAILGDGVDVTLIHAFLICLSVLIVYAFILRPFINLVGGKNGSRIFDITVMILIVLVGVKTLYPDIFTEGGYTKTDLDSYYDQGYSDGYDRGEGEGYDKGYADGSTDGGDTIALNTFNTVEEAVSSLFDWSQCFEFSPRSVGYYERFVSANEIVNIEAIDGIVPVTGIPCFIVDNVVYYVFYEHFQDYDDMGYATDSIIYSDWENI